VVQNFCTRKNLGAKKIQAKDSEIEKSEINVLTQNFKIEKIKETKKLKTKIRTHKSYTKGEGESEAGRILR
jgi:hypothetical protein